MDSFLVGQVVTLGGWLVCPLRADSYFPFLGENQLGDLLCSPPDVSDA